MKFWSKFLLVFVVLTFVGTPKVIADTYSCRTTTLPSDAFTTAKAARSWFPLNTTHVMKGNSFHFKEWNLTGTIDFASKRTYAKYVAQGRNFKYVFYKNGLLIVQMSTRSGYKTITAARGKCTKTSRTTQSKTSVKKKTTIKKPSGPNIPKQVQIELNRLGCSVGTADGAVGPASKRGLAKFANVTGVSGYSVSEFSNKQFLGFLKGMPAGFCN
jgi:hypothetical protein